MASELHIEAASRLRGDAQRYTAGRRRLVEVLRGAPHPLTIAEVLDRDGSLAQSSAYRNLGVLEEAGVVHRVVTDDEFHRFELTEAVTGHHHHHLVCSRCGRVEDFTVAPRLEARLDEALDQAASASGFVPDHHRLDLVGTCVECA